MKRKLLKLALCAAALLPLGAWAQTYDFKAIGKGLTGVTKPTFGADGATSDMQMISLGENVFDNRFSAGPKTQNSGSNCFSFRNNSSYEGLWSQYNNRTLGIQNLKAGDNLVITLNSDAGHQNIKFDTNTTEGIIEGITLGTTTVTSGQTYKILKDGVVVLITTGQTTIEKIVIYPTVSGEQTWNPNTFAAGDYPNVPTYLGEGLVARTNTNVSGRYVSVTAQSDLSSWTFGDGYTLSSITQCFVLGDNYQGTLVTYEPTEVGDMMRGTLAFKISEAGKLYVVASNSSSDKKITIANYNGSALTKPVNAQDISAIAEYSATVSAGTVYIGSDGAKVYAIRFVPTALASDSRWLYIGSTGYATFGNVGSKDVTLPSGLTAYSASVPSEGSSVVKLTKINGDLMHNEGYIIKGDETDKNYCLTYAATNTATETGGSMKIASSAHTNGSGMVASYTSDKTRYQYILANDGGTAKFFAPSGGTLGTYKAYLDTGYSLNAPSGAHGVGFILDDDMSTGIDKVQGSGSKGQGSDAYYNLAGQRVVQPTRGLYIVNGKKVIIK